jgi:hypothetical protein
MNQALLSKLENFGAQWCTKFAGRNGGQKKPCHLTWPEPGIELGKEHTVHFIRS